MKYYLVKEKRIFRISRSKVGSQLVPLFIIGLNKDENDIMRQDIIECWNWFAGFCPTNEITPREFMNYEFTKIEDVPEEEMPEYFEKELEKAKDERYEIRLQTELDDNND